MNKKCCKCKMVKPIGEFYKNRSYKDGLAVECKDCRKTDWKQRYQSNPEKSRAKAREYYRDHRDDICANVKERYKKYAEKLCLASHLWYQNNKERVYKINKMWQQNNPDKVRLIHQRLKGRFPEKVKARYAVQNAVSRGELPAIKTVRCTQCGNQAQEYHHYLGYSKENWLKVRPLCTKCHKNADKKFQGQK